MSEIKRTWQKNAHSPAVQLLPLLRAECGPAVHGLCTQQRPLPCGGAVHVVNVENAAVAVHSRLPTYTQHTRLFTQHVFYQHAEHPPSPSVTSFPLLPCILTPSLP